MWHLLYPRLSQRELPDLPRAVKEICIQVGMNCAVLFNRLFAVIGTSNIFIDAYGQIIHGYSYSSANEPIEYVIDKTNLPNSEEQRVTETQ
jgi:hypothetical protein